MFGTVFARDSTPNVPLTDIPPEFQLSSMWNSTQLPHYESVIIMSWNEMKMAEYRPQMANFAPNFRVRTFKSLFTLLTIWVSVQFIGYEFWYWNSHPLWVSNANIATDLSDIPYMSWNEHRFTTLYEFCSSMPMFCIDLLSGSPQEYGLIDIRVVLLDFHIWTSAYSHIIREC